MMSFLGGVGVLSSTKSSGIRLVAASRSSSTSTRRGMISICYIHSSSSSSRRYISGMSNTTLFPTKQPQQHQQQQHQQQKERKRSASDNENDNDSDNSSTAQQQQKQQMTDRKIVPSLYDK
mmetsp:Transcript_1437/g.1512  ORF Transcript_1437/g.1512 Transcript_1437/m.1512 type:complete len:121 (-) Transcript_1437:50-412(-)